MLSFGQLKNNLKRLEDCSKSMSIITKIGWSKAALDEKQIKNQPVQFYLRIIHYVLIEYSTELYKVILDMIPNIKALSDQKFVESAFSICRKVLGVSPKLTADQFLQQLKWVQKKVEFVAEMCESVQKWDQANRKKAGKDKPSHQFKNYLPEPVSKGYQQCEEEEDDDDEELMEREITVKPTQFLQPLNHSFGNRPEPIISKEPAYTHTKPNVFPKNLKNQYLDDEQEDYQLTQTTKLPQRKHHQHPTKPLKQQQPKPLPVPSQSQPQSNDSTEYISKQQFNIALQMIASTNKTINQLAGKFSNFQMNVTSWFNNTNARLVLLQQNVKMIKSNL